MEEKTKREKKEKEWNCRKMEEEDQENKKEEKRGEYAKKNKKFWEELIAYFPLIRHGPHGRRLQQFSSCCVCIPCRGNILPSCCLATIAGIHIQIHRLMGGT
jgi:hypothetical protein